MTIYREKSAQFKNIMMTIYSIIRSVVASNLLLNKVYILEMSVIISIL